MIEFEIILTLFVLNAIIFGLIFFGLYLRIYKLEKKGVKK